MSDIPSKCMQLQRTREPLRAELRTLSPPQQNQVLLKVRACGVCRTDLHVVDGELPNPGMPIVPGHETVGEVVSCGENVKLRVGTRLGVPWLGHTCGRCEFCTRGEENLCDNALFTGYQLDGGYAEHVIADARYCFEIPNAIDDARRASPMCMADRISLAAHGRRRSPPGNARHADEQCHCSQGRPLDPAARGAAAERRPAPAFRSLAHVGGGSVSTSSPRCGGGTSTEWGSIPPSGAR